MSKEHIEISGIVKEALPGAKFIVEIESNKQAKDIHCTISGKLRMNNINIAIGDKVDIEISPYDLTQGRIVWRYK